MPGTPKPSAALRQTQHYEAIHEDPERVKTGIAPPLFVLEGLYNVLPGCWWYPYFVARWHRHPS